METNMQTQILEILQNMQINMQLMQADMKAMQTDIKTIQSDMKIMQSDMKIMQSDMKIMQNKMKSMQADMKAMKTEIKNMQRNIESIQENMENRFRKVELQIREVIDCLTIVENSTMLMEKEYSDKISILFETRQDANKRIEEHKQDIRYLKQENEKNKIKIIELSQIGGLKQ